MTNDQIPDDWMADHQLVLVGANPLPCYVVAKLLLRPGRTLHLVHTPEMKDAVERIGESFPGWQRSEIDNPANPAVIKAAVQHALDQCVTGAVVGLNYTGGTKSMAVHAHHTAVSWQESTRREVIRTYLDAGTLSLYRDDHATPIYVQRKVDMKIDCLLKLHGIGLDPQRPAEREPRHADLCRTLAGAHQSEAGQNAYDRWCQRYLRRSKQTDRELVEGILSKAGLVQARLASVPDTDIAITKVADDLRGSTACRSELVEKKTQFPYNPIPFPTDGELAAVASSLREIFKIAGDSFDPVAVANDPGLGFRGIADLVKFLDGDWVEHWVLQCFNEVKAKTGIGDIATTLKTTKDPYDFEFDVAALQGYQLYAVSCTRSSDRHLCKSKLFEAVVRATQLGGDEAKVALVCCDRNAQQLQKQVVEAWRAKREHVRVFGPCELPVLTSHFESWLNIR